MLRSVTPINRIWHLGGNVYAGGKKPPEGGGLDREPTPKWAWVPDQQELTLVKYISRTLLKVNADGHAVF